MSLTIRNPAWSRRSDLWVLCGVGLGLLLVLARWWSLHAEGENRERQVWQARAEAEGLRPIVQQVKGLKARRDSLQSLVVGIVERPKLLLATEAVLTALEDDVVLETLEVSGQVRVVVRADDERTVERFMDSLGGSGGFAEVWGGDDLDDPPVPPRYEVRGNLLIPWPGAEE